MGLKIETASLGSLLFQRHWVGIGSAIAFTGLVSIYGFQKFLTFRERRRLRKILKRKQLERQETFAELRMKFTLTKEGLQLLETPTDELIRKLQLREVTAKEVLEVFIAKSLEVTQRLNCVTEYIPQAFEWAEKLDRLPSVKGPLHGIPFCVKDDHDVKGMDTTLGYAKFLNNPAAESAAIVKVLRDLGGVPFCKTNVPISLFSYGSQNPIFGTTINAHFPERQMAPGGSSSGTGALVAAGGTIFGLGSDIGGSVRIPAHCNGISGIRPTIGRFCAKGLGVNFLPGSAGLRGVSGILTKRPQLLSYIFKSIVEKDLQRKYDGTVVPVQWNAKIFDRERILRIGYYTSIPTFPALGSTEDIVVAAKEALEHLGHTLVPFDLPSDDVDHWCKLYIDLTFADLGQNLRALQYGEESSPSIRHLWMIHVPVWVRRLGAAFLSRVPGCRNLAKVLASGFDSETGSKLWKCLAQREAVIEQLLSAMENLHLDAILCPAFPFPALGVEDHHHKDLLDAATYTYIWNLVDFPAGVVRFGTETGKNLADVGEGDSSASVVAKKAIARSVGMPIGVQVVGKKFEEEMVLRLLNQLDDIYQNSSLLS